MKKKNDEQKAQFSHGPQAKREDRLFRMLRISILGHCLWLIGAIIVVSAFALKPDRVVVAEKETGRIVGEYRSTAYRTNDELIGASVKFAEYFLSLNSKTVYDDYAAAMNMMSPELMKKRREYFKQTNLPLKVEMADTRSHLVFDEKKILLVEGSFAKVDLSGKIVIDTRRNAVPSPRKKGTDEVKMKRNSVQFRLVAELQMVPVTPLNTSGVEVVDYYEYD